VCGVVWGSVASPGVACAVARSRRGGAHPVATGVPHRQRVQPTPGPRGLGGRPVGVG